MITPHSATGNGLQRMNVAMRFILNPGFACRSWAMDLKSLPPACATAGDVSWIPEEVGGLPVLWPEIRPPLAFPIDVVATHTKHCEGRNRTLRATAANDNQLATFSQQVDPV